MKPESACEKTVAEAYLNNVISRDSACDGDSCNAVAPDVDIFFSVNADSRLARRARLCVDSDNIFHRHRRHTERIIVSEIVFCSERDILNV